MNLFELIKKGESKILEFKKELPSAIGLAKSVVAFSNTAGGKIIIGISNEGEIIGIEENRLVDLQEKIASIVYDTVYPKVLPEIYALNTDDKILLVIEIFRGNQLPYYLKSKGKLKGTYVRVGSTNRLADESIIWELERQRMGKSFDEEENFDVDFENINTDFLSNEFEKCGKRITNAQLKNLKLVKNIGGKNIPTNALLILAGYFDNITIKCARFKGMTKDVFLDKKEFNQDVFSNLENAVLFLKNHLNLQAEIKDLKRTEEYEIPIVVLREILLNAIIHRDYTRNSDIKVAIYDDIVEVVSPGGLPNGLTVEDVLNGRSELRNKIIARVFKELGYVETWGSGIKRITGICKSRNIKFELKDEGNFVSAVFYRNKVGEKTFSTTDYDRLRPITTNYDQLMIEEKEILIYLLDNPVISRRQAVELLKLGTTKVKEVFNSLVGKGLIKRIGRGRSTRYVLRNSDGKSNP
jgi:ATP-dependent DNA helicase RecG